MDYIEVTGKTVEDARTEALIKLGTTSDQIEVEILEKGSSGFLGIGSKPAVIRVRRKFTMEDCVRDFLTQVFDAMDLTVDISVEVEEDNHTVNVELKGDEMGVLIGKRGQTLDSLQYLTSLALNRHTVLPPHKYAWNGPVVAMILDRVDYLGHTVNFKTHNKSYKCHKKIKHTPDQWKVFEDTHEAIIDKETFEIVQKIRAGKRRPTRMGEMPMFSGLLYCADCGSKLTFHRKADEPAEKHHYICGNYRSNTSNCTMHYIRNVVVERIVLENLKEVIRYVSNYEDEFVRMVMDADVRQKNRELAQKKKKLIELQKRIGELDTIFQRIYEDNITGKLSDERFMKMSKGYEDEQHTLQAEADKIQNELQQEEKKSVDVKRFLAIVKKYTDLTELTPEILREFVDKIIVHAPDKSSGRRLQEIEIIYNHIGEFDHSKVTLWKGNAV